MKKRDPSAQPLAKHYQRTLRNMVALNGEQGTCVILNCSRYTLARGMTGLPMYEGNRNELINKIKAIS